MNAKHRRRTVVAAAAVLAGGTLLAAGFWPRGSAPATVRPAATTRQVTIARTDLSTSFITDGTLGHGTPRTLRGATDGRVTWLPAQGVTITRGHQLYRVDDRPAVLFYGSTPLYRRLDTVGLVGPDVRVVADNLRALGYDIGPQPAVGTMVTPSSAPAAQSSGADSKTSADGAREPSAEPGPSDGEAAVEPTPTPTATAVPQPVEQGDAVLTSTLLAAIGRWQAALRLPATSVLDIGDIAVSAGAVRVDSLKAQTGDDAAADLMTVTGTRKVVTVELSADRFTSLRRGDRVTVTLPDGADTPGRVDTVGTTLTGADDADGADTAPTRTVTVTLDQASTAAGVDAAPVRVRFAGTTRKDVLVVPVGALVVPAGGGYAVQRPDGGFVRVTTGLFAEGQVEIKGPVKAGQRVVTTS
ncbi:hypothetical protein [Streptomyces sp. NPDC093568]|uniref:hypothetical protein n=1 Tax=Streptomyces sp. NPDC093568 TaxID=3366041 RepID=UPI0037F55FC0